MFTDICGVYSLILHITRLKSFDDCVSESIGINYAENSLELQRDMLSALAGGAKKSVLSLYNKGAILAPYSVTPVYQQ
jgi:hypothetical protein